MYIVKNRDYIMTKEENEMYQGVPQVPSNDHHQDLHDFNKQYFDAEYQQQLLEQEEQESME